ncbi:hypothetical protein ACMFMG_009664 [Clarireedia jacksonii]
MYVDTRDAFDTPETKPGGGIFGRDGVSMMREGGELEDADVGGAGIPTVGVEKFDLLWAEGPSQRCRGEGSGMQGCACVIRGEKRLEEKVDFKRGLQEVLEKGGWSPVLVHVDLDVLDSGLGKTNDFESPWGPVGRGGFGGVFGYDTEGTYADVLDGGELWSRCWGRG